MQGRSRTSGGWGVCHSGGAQAGHLLQNGHPVPGHPPLPEQGSGGPLRVVVLVLEAQKAGAQLTRTPCGAAHRQGPSQAQGPCRRQKAPTSCRLGTWVHGTPGSWPRSNRAAAGAQIPQPLQVQLFYPFARRVESAVKPSVFGTHDYGAAWPTHLGFQLWRACTDDGAMLQVPSSLWQT